MCLRESLAAKDRFNPNHHRKRWRKEEKMLGTREFRYPVRKVFYGSVEDEDLRPAGSLRPRIAIRSGRR